MKEKFDSLSAACSKLTTLKYSTSFSLGIYFLNKPLRHPIYAIYGFVRLADEIVDSFHGFDKTALLAKFKNDCYEAIEQKISLNPVLNSFQQVVNKYHIDKELIALFLRSMEMDLEKVHYNQNKYEEYILGSAQVVGLMCLHVFTGGDQTQYQALKPAAMKLGSAFQKVNFLRDLNADYTTLNRTYFPEVNLKNFSEIEKKKIELEIEQDFNEALEGIKKLPKSSRRGVYLAYIYYRKLLSKIKKASVQKVMSNRIRISNSQKFSLMFDSMIRYQINAL